MPEIKDKREKLTKKVNILSVCHKALSKSLQSDQMEELKDLEKQIREYKVKHYTKDKGKERNFSRENRDEEE